MCAIVGGHFHIVWMLVAMGANVNHRNDVRLVCGCLHRVAATACCANPGATLRCGAMRRGAVLTCHSGARLRCTTLWP